MRLDTLKMYKFQRVGGENVRMCSNKDQLTALSSSRLWVSSVLRAQEAGYLKTPRPKTQQGPSLQMVLFILQLSEESHIHSVAKLGPISP